MNTCVCVHLCEEDRREGQRRQDVVMENKMLLFMCKEPLFSARGPSSLVPRLFLVEERASVRDYYETTRKPGYEATLIPGRGVASFPGSTQLSVACSTEKRRKAGQGLGTKLAEEQKLSYMYISIIA